MGFFDQMPTGNGMLPQGAPLPPMQNQPLNPNVGQNLIASLARLLAAHPDEAQAQQLLLGLFHTQPDTFRNDKSVAGEGSFARYYPALAGYSVDNGRVTSAPGDTEEQALGRRTGFTPPDIFGTGRTPLSDADMYRMGAYRTKPDKGGGKPQKGKS